MPIKWKKNIINWGTKNNYNFIITKKQWPIIITNDFFLLKKIIVNNMYLNRWFIKNKISILARKSYFVLDKKNNLIYANNLISLKINKFIK